MARAELTSSSRFSSRRRPGRQRPTLGSPALKRYDQGVRSPEFRGGAGLAGGGRCSFVDCQVVLSPRYAFQAFARVLWALRLKLYGLASLRVAIAIRRRIRCQARPAYRPRQSCKGPRNSSRTKSVIEDRPISRIRMFMAVYA